MTHQDQIRHALWEIERTLRDSVFWQSAPPQASAFTSTEPFCIDTMSAEQWLQWVLAAIACDAGWRRSLASGARGCPLF